MLTLTQNGYGGGGDGDVCGGKRRVRRRVRGAKEALSLKETLRAPFPGFFRNLSGALLGAFLGAFIGPSGDLWQGGALRTTITGEGGDDSQRVNRVIPACGTHRHVCYVCILVRAQLTLKSHILAQTIS